MGNGEGIHQLALSPQQAARALNVSERTLWAKTQPRGPIPVARIGRLVRYDVRDLLRFLDEMKQRPSTAEGDTATTSDEKINTTLDAYSQSDIIRWQEENRR